MRSPMHKFITLIAVIVCVAMLSSVLFLAFSADHDCSHEDCAICYQIGICLHMLKSFALITVLLAIIMAACSSAAWTDSAMQGYYARTTLVANKVKLSN